MIDETPPAPAAPAPTRVNGRFLPGHKVRGGRKPGSFEAKKRVRVVIGEALLKALERGGDGLPPAVERWRALLKDKDSRVKLEAEKYLRECLYGRSPVNVNVAGQIGHVVVRFADALVAKAELLPSGDSESHVAPALTAALEGVEPK